MSTEQFSLCWDNFHKNMSMGMQSLLESEDLVDVTLAVEGRYLKAHKMVLSVCSPYFRELFQSNPCKHPIVFMKDVSYIALSDLLHFMYQGEVQVAQENLTTFIKTAEALQIKGLTGDTGVPNESESEIEPEVTSVSETSVKRALDTSEPKSTIIAKPKRFSGPASKRPKLSNTRAASVSPSPAIAVATENKYEVDFVNSNAPDDIDMKTEPGDTVEQSQNDIAEESQLDESTEENSAFDMGDETEDFSLIESNNDEPKPGTSAEIGDSQDIKQECGIQKKQKKKRLNKRMKYIFDGFVYHSNVISGHPPLRYLGCSENKRLGCHGRATLPLHGTPNQLKITKLHNHPPDITAEEKYAFIHQLKSAVRTMENSSLKNVYSAVAELYPKGAEELPFKSICSSLHRWRRDLSL
ncbi:hypothetical protein FQR65_LT08447 [Abscondita terminalis]|nr:hypothetical protein FQR65_LT08447 [Abscondita terminalis]